MKKYDIPFSPPDITEAEIAAVSDALRSGWITTGPRTKQFERETAGFCGAERAVCLSSATAALEPVSYTHLDVYKRQAGGFLAAFRLPAGRNSF